MKLTPLDIRHKEFKRGMRGYADTEVDEFLDEIADEFERLFKDNIDYEERIEALEARVGQYRTIEETLQKTLISAQHSADEMKTNATKQAQLILQEAEVQARTMSNEMFADKQKIEKQMVMLRGAEEEFRFKFQALLEGYLKQLVDVEQAAADRAAAEGAKNDNDFARQAEAIKDAIGREAVESATQAPAGPPAAPTVASEIAAAKVRSADVQPVPEYVDVKTEAPQQTRSGDTQPTPQHTQAPQQARPESTQAPQQDARAAQPEASTAIEPPMPSAEAPVERSLVGREDDLLADIENEIGDNEFKW